jgi:hypothetical protein
VTHPVDLVVDERILFDVGVALGDVRLGLIVVVVRDEVSGKNALNSPKSWAASVLFGEMTRVGRWMFAITLAIVKVFPDPVTPSSTTWRRPSWTRRVRISIARGWSPRGSYSA